MIFVKLKGGFANQVFILAFVNQICGNDENVLFVTNSLRSYKIKRNLELGNFFNLSEYKRYKFKYINPFFYIFLNIFFSIRLLTVNDNNFNLILNKKITKGFIPKFVNGYFQFYNKQNLDNFKIQIDNLKFKSLKKYRVKKYPLVMHIRGGDFLNLNQYNFIDSNYYKRAIELISQNNINNILVVTDDIFYAEKIIEKLSKIFKKIKFNIQNSNIRHDFYTFVYADRIILTNSTFSLIASYFSSAKYIISPSRFLSNGLRPSKFENEKVIKV